MSTKYLGNGTINGPHIRNDWTSQWKMKQVLIALIFPTIGATYFFWLAFVSDDHYQYPHMCIT